MLQYKVPIMSIQYLPSGRSASEIAANVETAIREGRLHPGEPLPPVRALATELGVSPATVAAAYRDLRLKGIARGNRRAGTRVTGSPPTSPRPPLAVPAGVRNLLNGSPDPLLLPPLPGIWGSAGAAFSPRMYGHPAVSPRLAAVASQRLEADGIDAANLAVVGGALDGVERILGASLRPGDKVAVEDPGYPPLFDLLTAMDLEAEPMAVDESGVRPDALAAAIVAGSSAAVFVPRAQSPTGAAWNSARAVELGRILATAPDLLIIEDDHAGEVAGARALSVASGRPRWASIRSVSKSLGPDLRLAVMAGDAVTISRVEGRQALGAGWVSYLLQDTVAELWRDPGVEDLLRRAAAVYANRRGQLIRALANRGIPANGSSGLAVWVPVADEAGATSALLERGWAVAPGERFRIASPPGIRIGVATLAAAEIDLLAADLRDSLRQRPRRSD
jgi:DNA-binding transcriptional MocR family regulator